MDQFQKSPLRIAIPVLNCLVLLGDAYCFNILQPLEVQIQEKFNIDQVSYYFINYLHLQTKYNLLYSVCSMPNLILPLFGGILIDKIGFRLILISCLIFLFIGTLLILISVVYGLYWLAIISRIIYGIGQESLLLSSYSIMVSWFTRDELRLAFGITVSFPRLGEALNSIITPQFYEINQTLFLPFFVALIIQTISLVSGLLLILLDKRGESKKPPKPKPDDNLHQTFTISALKDFKCSYWILLLICGFGEVLFLAFMFDINEYYQIRFGYNLTTAGDLIAIPYGIAAITTLVLGWYSQYIFKPKKSLIFGSLIYCFTYLLLSFLPQCRNGCFVSNFPLIGLGLCFGVFSVLFMPSIEEVIENKNVIGTGYGLVAMFQNLLLSLLPIITGEVYGNEKIEDKDEENFKFVEISKIYFLISLLLFAISLVFVITNSQIQEPQDKDITIEQELTSIPQATE